MTEFSNENEYVPDFVSPPGETLQELLDQRGMSRHELAEALSMSVPRLDQILTGDAIITGDNARVLEDRLGVSAQFWLAREENYASYVAEQLKGAQPRRNAS